MVLDLMTQLDREFTERNKIETLLRELLDARRNRKSEQPSVDQLNLFAAAWQGRQAEAEMPETPGGSDDADAATPGAGDEAQKKRSGGRRPLAASQARAYRARSDGRREALRRPSARSAAHWGRVERALRIHSSATDRHRGCVQEIRLRLHSEDGHQATAADRTEHGRSQSAGAGDRRQDRLSSAVAPARESLRASWRGHLTQDHGRVAGSMRRSAASPYMDLSRTFCSSRK